MIVIAPCGFNPTLVASVVSSLDKALYDKLSLLGLTTIIFAWWLQTSSKLTGKKSLSHMEHLEIGNS